MLDSGQSYLLLKKRPFCKDVFSAMMQTVTSIQQGRQEKNWVRSATFGFAAPAEEHLLEGATTGPSS